MNDYSVSYAVDSSIILINGGHLIAKGGTASGRKIFNDSIGICVNKSMTIAGGRVTASGKTYGVTGGGAKLSFAQYSEGSLYAVGGQSAIGVETIDEGVIAHGSAAENASEESVTDEIARQDASIDVYREEDGVYVGNFDRYEYTTGGALAKTVVARRDNERKVDIADLGAELSEEAGSEVSYSLVTKNIKAEEIPQIEWTKDVPSGISASFADEKLVFKTDGTAKRGVYPFKLAFGEGEKRVVSEEAALSVGSYAAKIICGNKPDAYFDTFFEALKNATLTENEGCRLLLFKAVSADEEITLDGDFTLDLNGCDVTCGALIIKNGAGVWGKGNISIGKIGEGGKVGGGTYELLLTTDGKNIYDHLIEDTFCIQKEDRNTVGKYWYELSAVTSMENAVVHPVSFKTDPVADVEAKTGQREIRVPINFHETPYYEKSGYIIEKMILTDENGKEIVFKSSLSSSFTGLDKDYNVYPVKDKTTNYTIDNSSSALEVGVYKAYAVISAYLGVKEIDRSGWTDTLPVEKYITKTEPFEIRIGISKPGYFTVEDTVDPDGNVIEGWNIYSRYTYTGAPRQLVHSVPQMFNGIMMYRFSESDEWTEEVPTATEPGEYTFQCYIKGNDGYMDVPMRDGRAVINSAVLEDNSGSLLKDDKYFVHFTDALDEAVKKENEGKLLRLYYADKGGFALGGDTKMKLGLESAATVGEISLFGMSQL